MFFDFLLWKMTGDFGESPYTSRIITQKKGFGKYYC